MTITYQPRDGRAQAPARHAAADLGAGRRRVPPRAVVNAALIAVVILIAGKLAYGIDIDAPRDWSASLIATVVGSVSFCALGFALTVVIPNQAAATGDHEHDRAAAVLHLRRLRLGREPADVLATIGEFFPIYHLGACLFESFSPDATGIGLPVEGPARSWSPGACSGCLRLLEVPLGTSGRRADAATARSRQRAASG